MSKPDEFEATRQVVTTLEPFENSTRELILRWARDKLGMGAPLSVGSPSSSASVGAPLVLSRSDQSVDIRSFIAAKNPRTDTQLSAVVAYFHRFVAPEAERRDAIGKEDVLNACRLADRQRPKRPDQTLVNAYTAGYFDKAERGKYRLNSVGENLVAVALPGAPGDAFQPPQRTRATKQAKSRRKTGGASRKAPKRRTRR